MEKKYTLQDLSALLAERESLSPEQAENFVRTFFELTEEGLLKDSFVKVTGFGTFKLVEVSERESVNINTGERFQISGHNKISFTPDGTLRELVNRPFAHFTTVTLNDNTPETALEAVEQSNEEATITLAGNEVPLSETPADEVVLASTLHEEKTQIVDSTKEISEHRPTQPGETGQSVPSSAEHNTADETTHTVNTENQEKEEAKPIATEKTTHALVSTSSLLRRPTPAPIIADSLLASQTPSPVLNNELFSELLTESPNTTAVIVEDELEKEEEKASNSIEDTEEANESTEEIAKNSIEEAEQSKTEEIVAEDFVDTRDTPEEIDSTAVLPTQAENGIAPTVAATVAAPVIDLELSAPHTTALSEDPTPVNEKSTEENAETPDQDEPSCGPALQFVPTREALLAFAKDKGETQIQSSTPVELPLRDQYRYPIDIEIKHSDFTTALSDIPTEPTEKQEEAPVLCNDTDATEEHIIEIPEALVETEKETQEAEENGKELLSEGDGNATNSPVETSTIAVPQIDLHVLTEMKGSTTNNEQVQTEETETTEQQETTSEKKSETQGSASATAPTTEKKTHQKPRKRSRHRHRKHKSGEKMLGLFLLLFVLCCCAFGYLCYSRIITPKDIPSWLHPVYEFFSPEDENGLHVSSGVIGSANAQSVQSALPTPAQRAAIAKAKEDSAKAEAIASAECVAAKAKADAERQSRLQAVYALAANHPQVKEGSMLITGTHAVHKMKAGDNLYILAERTYGSRSYAKYIIEYNNIKNPDFIKVNKVLKLPKLVNPKSIK